MNAPVVVTGGAGFIGAHLADRLAAEGRPVRVLDSFARKGGRERLERLLRRHPGRITLIEADVRDRAAVRAALRGAEAAFHLAAQVAVTTSLASPREDFEINAAATLGLLEIARQESAAVLFASTNKVYGALSEIALDATGEAYVPEDETLARHGVAETRALDFRTPYGCSKGAADQYVLDYARTFGLPAASLRMSCVYGPWQSGGEDQGWVAHFAAQALRGRAITIYGDGRQVRDLLYVEDCVEAWLLAWRRIDQIAGRALNLGGGPGACASVLDVLRRLGTLIGRPVEVMFAPWRPGDQRWYVSDVRAARAALGLPPPRAWPEGLAALLQVMTDRPVTEPAL